MKDYNFVDASENFAGDEPDDNEIEYDKSVYDFLEFAQAGYPCLTFDFIRGDYFEQLQQDTYRVFLLTGSQADTGKNSLTLIHISNLQKIQHSKEKTRKNSDEESDESDMSDSDTIHDTDKSAIFEHAAFNHQGVCNRIRCTDLTNQTGIKEIPFAASWSECGNVYIWDLKKPLEAVQDAHAMSSFIRSRGNQLILSYTHDAHTTEGFALDWSVTNKGYLLTGDCAGSIRMLQPGSKSAWEEINNHYDWHKGSVEDIQWSPCENSVFASASTDRCIAIWDSRVGNRCQLYVDNAHSSHVNVISWNSKDITLLASGGDDGRIKVWDLRLLASSSSNQASDCATSISNKDDECSALIASFSFHKKPITSIEWNPNDSSVLAASSEDGQITLWDLGVEKVNTGCSDDHDNVPAQMMFNHEGLVDIKEVHWHRGILGLIGSTSINGLCLFKSISI